MPLAYSTAKHVNVLIRSSPGAPLNEVLKQKQTGLGEDDHEQTVEFFN